VSGRKIQAEISLLIKRRLDEMGLEQRDLARAAEVLAKMAGLQRRGELQKSLGDAPTPLFKLIDKGGPDRLRLALSRIEC
jgi:hypothetical protein